ncbi:MAG: acyloxyacyl hydrolase [Desulfosarcina sp.]
MRFFVFTNNPICRWFRFPRNAPLVIACLTISVASHAFDQPSHTCMIMEVRAGLSAHDVDGLWGGHSKENGTNLNLELVLNRPLFRLLSATAYPNLGASLNFQGNTSKIYAGFLLQWEPLPRFFFSTGLGVALHDGERDTDMPDQKSLGTRVLFRIPIEVGLAASRHHRILLVFDHVSNAYLSSPNEGMDSFGLMYGYRF